MGRGRMVMVAGVIAGLVTATPALASMPGQWSGGGPPAGIVGALGVDPADPQIVYAGGATAMYRTGDGAATWQMVSPPPASGSATSIVVNPAAPRTVYALAGSELFRSSDSARSWTRLDAARFVSVFALLPGQPAALLAATLENGVQRSDDGGATWEPSSEGLDDPNSIFELAVAPSDPEIVYASGGGTLYRSPDRGRTWSRAGLPEGVEFASSLTVDPSDPGTLYVVGSVAVYRSTDAGMTWTEQSNGLDLGDEGFIPALVAVRSQPTTLYALTDRALFRSTNAGGEWALVNDDEFNAVPPWVLAVDPADPEHLYRASGSGVFVSTDGGGTFVPASAGLPGLAVQAVAPGPGGIVHAGLFFGGILSSADGGSTWRPGTGDDIEFESLQALAADAGERVYAGSYTGRFFRSDNAGRTWESMGQRLPRSPIWCITPDPGIPERVLAATEVGVYRSGSAGDTWRRSSRGLPNTGVRALAFARASPNVVYAGLDRHGTFRSTDGGRNWRSAGLARLTVLSLAVDPRDPNVVYAATRSGGAFRSDDGGRRWKRLVATGLTGSVVVDPASPDTVLLATDGRVLRSTTRGDALVPYGEGLPARGGTPLDPEAGAPLTVVELAAVPGGAYAATWAGVFGVVLE